MTEVSDVYKRATKAQLIAMNEASTEQIRELRNEVGDKSAALVDAQAKVDEIDEMRWLAEEQAAELDTMDDILELAYRQQRDLALVVEGLFNQIMWAFSMSNSIRNYLGDDETLVKGLQETLHNELRNSILSGQDGEYTVTGLLAALEEEGDELATIDTKLDELRGERDQLLDERDDILNNLDAVESELVTCGPECDCTCGEDALGNVIDLDTVNLVGGAAVAYMDGNKALWNSKMLDEPLFAVPITNETYDGTDGTDAVDRWGISE
jgi:chromosome segregation ATPase